MLISMNSEGGISKPTVPSVVQGLMLHCTRIPQIEFNGLKGYHISYQQKGSRLDMHPVEVPRQIKKQLSSFQITFKQ